MHPLPSNSQDLTRLTVLLVDCQTTTGSPHTGHLLEVGWLACRAADAAQVDLLAVETALVALPAGETLPTPVGRLTGIDDAMLTDAPMPETVWRKLCGVAAQTARLSGGARCPAVIHYARFEMPFLTALHSAHRRSADFPLNVVCTHEIARRLFPSLPRKGLRALAGFLGHSVPMAKRCADHLRATAVIWRQVVQTLTQVHGVRTFDQLQQWLAETPAPRAMPRSYPMEKGRRKTIPDAPGVYRFLRPNGDLLYIGKARSLKVRMNSYFQPGRRHGERTLEMLSQAMRFEVTTTASALEAAILESEAIKQYGPPYNVALTSGDRVLHFCSRDFGERAGRPDPVCRLGPLLSGDLIDTVHGIGRALGRLDTKAVKELQTTLFTRWEERGADLACIQAGLDLLSREYAELLNRHSLWRALLAIGRQRWIERLAARAENDDLPPADEDAEASDPETAQSEVVTPEAVCRRVVGVLCHCGHQLRRARWLTLLCESVVAWQRPESGCRRVMVIAGGTVLDRQEIADHALLPVPPESGRSWQARQDLMDLQAYDRLRVLTTEVRRLLAENRNVWIATGRRVVLDASVLRRLLRWI